MSKELTDDDVETILAGFRALRYLLDISEELQSFNDFMCEIISELREVKEELRELKKDKL